MTAVSTHTDTRRLSQALASAAVDPTFIDANYHHPWPLLDLLHMTALARTGSWAILHDVRLPVVAPAFAELVQRAWEFASTLWHVALPAPFGSI